MNKIGTSGLRRKFLAAGDFDSAAGSKTTSPAAETFFDRVKEFWEDLKE